MKTITKSEIMSQQLSKATYNGQDIQPNLNRPNICMGIGMWSAKDKLSIGLPVDVMQMLLAATILSGQIAETHPGTRPKLIILIADGMAIREGADPAEVKDLVAKYQKCLESLLNLLKMQESSQLLLASQVEGLTEYQTVLDDTKQNSNMQALISDIQHYNYILTQTALISYLEEHEKVGVKVGWLCEGSAKELEHGMTAAALKNWDELKFDRLRSQICCSSTMQYLYTKAGLKQTGNGKNISISEGCPYTAYPNDNRYIMQNSGSNNCIVKNISKKIAQHWSRVAEVCSVLSYREIDLLPANIIPPDAIKKNNNVATVTNILNYWVNVGCAGISL
ncbi:MAG: hypothetical protein LW826_06500 [Candidatus Jidaibacter sp.]|nr:hypothetical protein [Candidatus Jidaibacter sp.]